MPNSRVPRNGSYAVPLPEHYLNFPIPRRSMSQSNMLDNPMMGGMNPTYLTRNNLPTSSGNTTVASNPTPFGPAPPVPARPSSHYMPRFNGYNNMYMPYSRLSSGLYGPSYGGYGMPYSSYGNNSYNSFIQMAEDSSRPAFEAIESVVQVVGSISMMLDSTYHAVHSSYSAILGVVDHFSRLKDHLAQFLSALAILRALRWLCLKVLYFLKLRKENPSAENIWSELEKVAEGIESSENLQPVSKHSAFPFILFLGIVIGAPWLMFKLLSRAIPKKPFKVSDVKGPQTMGIALYDFTATNKDEVSFKAGERMFIMPESLQRNSTGWYNVIKNKNEKGLVPANYLQLKKIIVVSANKSTDNVTREDSKENSSSSIPEHNQLVSEFAQELNSTEKDPNRDVNKSSNTVNNVPQNP